MTWGWYVPFVSITGNSYSELSCNFVYGSKIYVSFFYCFSFPLSVIIIVSFFLFSAALLFLTKYFIKRQEMKGNLFF